MFSQPIYIATVLLVILAIGELVSIWSKARIPSLLVILIGYLLLNWAGLFPKGVVSRLCSDGVRGSHGGSADCTHGDINTAEINTFPI